MSNLSPPHQSPIDKSINPNVCPSCSSCNSSPAGLLSGPRNKAVCNDCGRTWINTWDLSGHIITQTLLPDEPHQSPILPSQAGLSQADPRRRFCGNIHSDLPRRATRTLIAILAAVVIWAALCLICRPHRADAQTAANLVPAPPIIAADPVMTVLKSRLKREPHNELLIWCSAVLSDPNQPYWKHRVAINAVNGAARKFTAHATWYCPGHRHVDPQGGNMNPAWSLGRKLRDGDAAADNRYHGFGEVIFCAGKSRIVVDNGPAVRGPCHLDLCAVSPSEFRCCDRTQSGSQVAWVLGHIERCAAK